MASNGRFLTTHVGSLPRPDDLIAMMWAREDGIPVDRAAIEERVCRAVDEVVARQANAGIDIVNDGEWGKPSYATYIKDRLNGFGGTGNTFVFQDIEAFPQTKARVFADPGRTHRKTPACDAPISVRDVEAPRKDAERLKTALKAHGAAGAFLTAASPGVTALFFRNEYYRTHEDYVFAIAEAMRHEYETIAAAGVTLQVDCPDLAMGRHTQFKDLDLAGFRERMELNIEALNRALVNIRLNRSGCICAGATIPVRTTATCRFRTSLTSCGRRSRMRFNSRRRTRATPTSGPCSKRSRCRKAKC
jgi:5-methyltetrahydropteroyltriglutamate--homocysteine methyltransferase